MKRWVWIIIIVLVTPAVVAQEPVVDGPFGTPAFWLVFYRLADGSSLTGLTRATDTGGQCLVGMPAVDCPSPSAPCMAREALPSVLRQTPLCAIAGVKRGWRVITYQPSQP